MRYYPIIVFLLFFVSLTKAQSSLLLKLDSISSDPQQKETTQLFGRLYKATTAAINRGIARGDFADTTFVQSFENCFATYFWSVVNTPQLRTTGWQMVYACDTSECNVLQKLLLAINAHINDDLLKSYVNMGKQYNIAQYKSTADMVGLRVVEVVDSIISRYRQHFAGMSAYDKMQINIARKKIKRIIIKERSAIFQRYLQIANGADTMTILAQQEKVSKHYARILRHPKGLFRYFMNKLNRKYPLKREILMKLIY